MRYWILTLEYPPYYGGGIGTYSAQLAKLLAAEHVQVSVFVPDKNAETIIEEESENIRVIRFSPYLSESASFLGYDAMVSLSFSCVLEKYLDSEPMPDWVEAHEYNGIAYYTLQKKHLAYPAFKDLKIVVTCHCPSFLLLYYNEASQYTLPAYWTGEMEKFCIEAADICISPSQYLINQLKATGIYRNNWEVLANPYDITDPIKNESTNSDSLLFVGKVSPAKGIIELLDAFVLVSKKNTSITLTIIGDQNFYYHSKGKLMHAYLQEKYAALFESGRVIVKGVLPYAEAKKYIQNARLLILPSKVETLPYVVVESMYLSTPVLASSTGGQVEIIEDGKNSFLYEPGSAKLLSDKIEHILALSPEEIASVQQAGETTIRKKFGSVSYYSQKLTLLNNFAPFAKNNFPVASAIKGIATPSEPGSLLSIIIPFFNLGDYVKETVDSILASDYKNLEIIIIDDGSTDSKSVQVLETFRGDKRIRIISQPNAGLAATRNSGAQWATGEYISFLDADDKVHPGYYKKAIEVLQQKHNLHFVGAWTKYFGESTNSWASFTPVFPYIFFHNMVNSSSLVYKRSSFIQHGLNDPAFIYGMEDYDSVISLMCNGCYGAVLPEFLFYYRVRKDSMSRGFNEVNQKYLYELIAKKHRQVLSLYVTEISCLLNANGPGYKIDNPTRSSKIYFRNKYINNGVHRLIDLVKRSPRMRSAILKLKSKRG